MYGAFCTTSNWLDCWNSQERLHQKIRYVYKQKKFESHALSWTGLDSQILGDFEIINPIERSVFVWKKTKFS
jgi:hypothetical protein